MNGSHGLLVGANLPCAKMNASRDNPAPTSIARQTRMTTSCRRGEGHDAVYSYKCHDGKVEIIGNPWKLDKRGFAKELWTTLPER
jgi:hypothetical protein